MKEATGEMNMTVVTIIAIGAIIAFFWVMWPTIRQTISGTFRNTSSDNVQQCGQGEYWNGQACVRDNL